MNTALLSLLTFTLVHLSSAGVISEDERDGKVLPFLAVVSFPHIECTVMTGGMSTRGVCYSRKQCTNKGGSELGGTCAQGYGVCCSFSESCPVGGGTVMIRNNLTTIVGNTAQSCSFVIPKQPDVCQIRLDFQQFQLGDYKYGPVTDTPPGDPAALANYGSCVNDKLMISPTQNLPDGIVLCGSGNNQHLYLHYGDQEKITLSLTQMTMGNYVIKVTMIKCNSLLRAPHGCTQYFREKTARVLSFNFPNMQLNSHRYSVCVHNSDGERQIQWRGCTSPTVSTTTTFFVSGMTPPVPQLKGPENCGTDYIILPGTGSERYCGGNFTMVEESRVIPFTMWVNFDDAETPKELIPSTFIDKTNGCPLGFTCTIALCTPGPDPVINGICFPPQGYAVLQDRYNIGFCLEYVLGST